MHHIATYPDRATQAAALASEVATQLRAALLTQDHATLAVPGGTTPGPFLEALSQIDLDWPRVRVLLTDERRVPETSPRSNTRLLRETLLQNHAAGAVLVYMGGEGPMDAVEGTVQAVLPLDVCVLGMGLDMHIASLFPGADHLKQGLAMDCPKAILPMTAPGAPEARLTLTAPVLNQARHLHLLITGAEKRAALDAAMTVETPMDAPVKLLLGRENLTVHHTFGDT